MRDGDRLSRPLRIVLAVASLEIAGTEQQALRLACELKARGHDVLVLTLAEPGPLASELERCGVPSRDLGMDRSRRSPLALLSTLVALARLLLILRRWRADVVHAFLFWAYVIVIPVAWLARVPVRITGRRNLGTEKSARRFYPWLERVADRLSHAAVANAEAVADALRAGGVREHKIVVIPNGVDVPEPAHSVGAQPARGVMIANLIAYKGHLDLVAALGAMDEPPRIDCYGDGPERRAIAAAVAAQGLEDVMVLHSREANAARHYRDAQFAVLTSHEEGSPNAVLEAMAYGLPVVATAVGGVPELVAHGATGYLVPRGNPVELAAAIASIASQPVLRERLGRAGREVVLQRHRWEVVASAYLELCFELMNSHVRRRELHGRDPV